MSTSIRPQRAVYTNALINLTLLLTPALAGAGPWVEVGNSSLRSDIQILADAGVITGAVTTWPLAWGDIAPDLASTGRIKLLPWQQDALERVRVAASQQMLTSEVVPHARAAVAGNPVQIRSFENTPREDGEIELGLEYTGNWFATNLQGSWVDDPEDGREWRADGSYAAVMLGNWSVAATAQSRWWGPGWQGSMIYSNNARPVPSIALDRNATDPFQTKWLSWIGHWDLSVQVGQLESDRFVPDALLFAMRFTLRPLDSLEIGLSRSALLCGDGRSCDFDTWKDMLLGNDNAGDNVSEEGEPGDQIAGWDIRWSNHSFTQPFALYTHWVGEDEGGGLPAKYAGQFGGETWGGINALGTYRVYLEWADTTCNFALYKGSDRQVPNCEYNNGTYRTGYRYRGRSLAQSFDNDASVFTLGTVLTDTHNHSWLLKVGYGTLNSIGTPDQRNTVAQVKTDYREILLTHRRDFRFRDVSLGALHMGLGYDYRKNTVTNDSNGDTQVFLEWLYDVN